MNAYESGSVNVGERDARAPFHYRFMRPAALEPDTSYPVVLFLHGAGERGSDNERQLKYLPEWMAEPAMRKRHPCYFVAPQCRSDHRWVEAAWSDRKSTPQPPEMTTDLAAAVAALDEVLAMEGADPRRVYLTGLSMGGFGAWDLAARMPKRFAAVMPICGGGDESTAARLVNLPIWCFHGAIDTVVLPERSRRMIEAVKAAGGTPTYTEFAGVGHDSWTPAYRDPAVLDWLFHQRGK